jgi:hypothetical protein
LFNVYDVCTGELVKVSPIFAFREDPSASINGAVQRRIIITDGGREFEFEQYLLEEDNGVIYGYRLFDTRVASQDYWYNPTTGVLKQWNGKAWQTQFITRNSSGDFEVHTPYVGETPPAYLVTIANSIWYSPLEQIVRRSNGTTWEDVAWPEYNNPITSPLPQGLLIEGADPTLTTIWRSVDQYTHNTSGPPNTWTGGVYTPSWVDGDRNPLPVGDPAGDWEIPDQWRFNPEHENRSRIRYSELLTHFRSIIEAQENPFGFPGGGVSSLPQSAMDYSLGGFIKEHNDSYDTLISSINVTNTTPVSVLEFAQDQYTNLLLTIQELFIKNMQSILTNTSTNAIVDFTTFAANTVIDAYEANDFYGQVYVDTSAFDDTTGLGVRHWISTIPMFGLGFKTAPHLNIDRRRGIYEVVHHDGHRSDVILTAGQETALLACW